MTYAIVESVAYDKIQYRKALENLVKDSDVFIYGSLAARSATTRGTLLQLLDHADEKVFDVNLRAPFYNQETVEMLLKKASIVKMNHHELMEIAGWYSQRQVEKEMMQALVEMFSFKMLIVTRGENGAAVFANGSYYEHPGYEVAVVDTIGSGDAFLATFLANHFKGNSMDLCLAKACKIGSLVASKKGATPAFDANEY